MKKSFAQKSLISMVALGAILTAQPAWSASSMAASGQIKVLSKQLKVTDDPLDFIIGIGKREDDTETYQFASNSEVDLKAVAAKFADLAESTNIRPMNVVKQLRQAKQDIEASEDYKYLEKVRGKNFLKMCFVLVEGSSPSSPPTYSLYTKSTLNNLNDVKATENTELRWQYNNEDLYKDVIEDFEQRYVNEFKEALASKLANLAALARAEENKKTDADSYQQQILDLMKEIQNVSKPDSVKPDSASSGRDDAKSTKKPDSTTEEKKDKPNPELVK